MSQKKVELISKEEEELYENSRRTPVKKKSVYRIVYKCLSKYYIKGKIHEVTFAEVDLEVRKQFPTSKFNPFHLAHYKHKFLIEAPR